MGQKHVRSASVEEVVEDSEPERQEIRRIHKEARRKRKAKGWTDDIEVIELTDSEPGLPQLRAVDQARPSGSTVMEISGEKLNLPHLLLRS